ncbi:uncharacterized protein LOC135149272 [Daucus carota subsp. sativus]|uniref:uncharacterized protein LOC135149272 n=1 Tax=Daucus carota subsp. sativus TaxID=79200 RepID=UPI0030827BC5
MEEIINEGVRRSTAVYNLSETDNFNSYQEVDSEDLDSEELDGSDDANDSDSSSDAGADGQNNEANYTEEHTPSAPWFATEDVTNNDNPGFIPNFNPLTDDLFEGQCFADKQTAISAIKEIHIKKSRNYHVVKSTTTLYEAKCVVSGCPWRIRAIKRKRYGHFEITKLPVEHNCLLRTIQRDHKQLSSKLIADVIKNQVKESLYLKVRNIQSQITEMYKYHVSYKKAWIGKQKAISDVYGDWATSYSKLPQFLTALMHFNPGTRAIIEAENITGDEITSVCKRVWWAFKPMVDGWRHARPVISIDGTFLKGRYNGKLLIAMGFDSNNHQYPLAYGLVDEETTINWSCNFSSAYPGTHLKMLCWLAGNTSQVRKFDAAMKQIKELNPDAENGFVISRLRCGQCLLMEDIVMGKQRQI